MFLLEAFVNAFHDGSWKYWLLMQSVKSLEEGLEVLAKLPSGYQYRLFCGRDRGYLYYNRAENCWQESKVK